MDHLRPLYRRVVRLSESLKTLRKAELDLQEARDAVSRAAIKSKISRDGLFESSIFILRATGHAWADAARREGFLQSIEQVRHWFTGSCDVQADGLELTLYPAATIKGFSSKGRKLCRPPAVAGSRKRKKASSLKNTSRSKHRVRRSK